MEMNENDPNIPNIPNVPNDLNDSIEPRMSELPAPVNTGNYKKMTIPKEKEIKQKIQHLEISSITNFKFLKKFSEDFMLKKDNLILEINSYLNKLKSEYNKDPNLVEKPSQDAPKIESDHDFMKSVDNYIKIMDKINKLYSQIFDSIKQNLEIMNKFLYKFTK